VPSSPIRAIIFDIGRVLVRVDVSRAMQGLAAGTGFTSAELWSAIEKDPRWKDWQEGRMSPRDWYLHLAQRLGGGLSFDQFTEVWNRVLDPVPIHDNAFLEKLSRRYRLGLLSNTDPIHVRHLEGSFDFLKLFPARIYSCAVAVSKPSPLIYREALKAVKARAGEALYIDDVAAYVEAAKRLGMASIQFQNPDQLASDMKAIGVRLD